MKQKNRYPLGKRIKYELDNFISKGLWAQILLLVIASFIFACIFGLVAMCLGEPNYEEGYWESLMHLIDQGTITGDESGTDAYFLFMLLVTFVGMAITGTIIAIITSSMQDKLNGLKKGRSNIIEKNHIVILGFDENSYAICRELTEGSRINGEKTCLVVADDLSKEDMEQDMADYYTSQQEFIEKSSKKNKKEKEMNVLFRSGDPISENTFVMCNIHKAKAILINKRNDFDVIRILLSLSAYLNKNNAYLKNDNMPSIFTFISNPDNLSAAYIAAGLEYENDSVQYEKNAYKINIAYDLDLLTKLFSQSCMDHGLPLVVDGLFNYRGSSIHVEQENKYAEKEEENPFIGKSLPEITQMVSDCIPIGFVRNNGKEPLCVKLNPSEEQTVNIGDRLIYLSVNNKLNIEEREPVKPLGTPVKEWENTERNIRNFLLIGNKISMSDVTKYMGGYYLEGSATNLISLDDAELLEMTGTIPGTCAFRCDNPYRFEYVKTIIEQNDYWLDSNDARHLTNIIILSPDIDDVSLADEQVMVLLLNIRQYLKTRNIMDINVTSIMQLNQNQMLLQKNNDTDFIAVTGIINRMSAQIADDPRKYYIISELLEQQNVSIQLHSISDYVDTTKEFNFEGVFRFASALEREKGNMIIPLGWLQINGNDLTGSGKPLLILNPSREELEICHTGENHDEFQLAIMTKGILKN